MRFPIAICLMRIAAGLFLAPNGLQRQQFEYPLLVVELTKRGHRRTDAIDPERTYSHAQTCDIWGVGGL